MVELEEKYSFRAASFVVKYRNLYQTEGLHLKLFVLSTELVWTDLRLLQTNQKRLSERLNSDRIAQS